MNPENQEVQPTLISKQCAPFAPVHHYPKVHFPKAADLRGIYPSDDQQIGTENERNLLNLILQEEN